MDLTNAVTVPPCAKVPLWWHLCEVYLANMSNRSPHIRAAIIGSGGGTNARALCEHASSGTARYVVGLIISTKANIGILDVASQHGVPCRVCDAKDTFDQDVCAALRDHQIDLVLLAGLMRHISSTTIAAVNGNMLNIHPSLLPRHGGQGMYGIHVHRAVLSAGEAQTGATVHVVTDEYDQGQIIDQQSVDVVHGETAEQLQERVKALEHRLYPRAVDKFCEMLQTSASSSESGVKWAF
jgi:phosphoribosylglycinamide formyltransferase-1